MKLRKHFTMKLSEKTTSLLKNFSSINGSILVKEGTSIKTMSPMKNILAEATIDEDMPRDFAIYDLPQFLNTIDLMDGPLLDFTNEHYVIIKRERSKFKYWFCDHTLVTSLPEKQIELPSRDVCFQLEQEQLRQLTRAADVLGLPDMSAIGDGNTIRLVARDKNNQTSNDYSIVVGETDKEFIFNFKRENIKIIPESYYVVISKKQLASFSNTKLNLNYFIALEPDSVYND